MNDVLVPVADSEPGNLHHVARTLGPWGAGLAGYNSQDRLLIVVVAKPKNPVAWARKGVSKVDRQRVQKALDELCAGDDPRTGPQHSEAEEVSDEGVPSAG